MTNRPYAHASYKIDGARLRELRKAAGLSVTQAAKKVGISISYLAAIERGVRKTVPPATFNQICSELDIERAELDTDSNGTRAAA